jgi:hypothetical protein
LETLLGSVELFNLKLMGINKRFYMWKVFMIFMVVFTFLTSTMVWANTPEEIESARQSLQGTIDSGGRFPNLGQVRATGAAPEGFVAIGDSQGNITHHVSVSRLMKWQDDGGTLRGQLEKEAGDVGLKVNIAGAFAIFSGIQDPLAIVLGVLALAIMHILPLSATLDTLYLISPSFSSKVEEKKEGGGGMTQEGKNGKTYILWISREAQDALEKSYETGKPPYKQFLVFLVIKYVMAAVLMGFVFTGNYMDLLFAAMGLIEGLTSLFG